MNFAQAVRSCFADYATFQGRAARSEYWYWILFYSLILTVGALSVGLSGFAVGDGPGSIVVVLAIGMLALFLPTLAVSIRRFHDMDRSGWWFLVWFVPYVGSFIVIIWFMFRGTDGPNRFGPDPLGGRADPDETSYTHKSSIPKVNRDD